MTSPFPDLSTHQGISDPFRLESTLSRFDHINREDPHRIEYQGRSFPAEFLLAQALSYRVLQLNPGASEPLRLASRCQHLRRWERPRNTYPPGRQGYLTWRSDLKVFHAEQAARILADCGYGADVLEAVRALNQKMDIHSNPDCQTLEDGLCLVFLEFQFADIVSRHPAGKVIGILKKTANKMSPKAVQAARTLHYSSKEASLFQKAIA